MRRQMHKPESDINTAKREMEMYALTLLLNALAFFFSFQDLKKRLQTEEKRAPGRENAGSPAGHGCRGQSLRLKRVPWMNLPPLLLLLLSTLYA